MYNLAISRIARLHNLSNKALLILLLSFDLPLDDHLIFVEFCFQGGREIEDFVFLEGWEEESACQVEALFYVGLWLR